METRAHDQHLTDEELFALALPPAGEPEALPWHLSECFRCSRALQDWKSAVRELADEEVAELDRRTPAEWEALENETIEALRRSRRSVRRQALKWAVSIAACLVVAILLLPARKSGRGQAARPTTAARLSAQDQKDDALLRDVARLSRGEDSGSWNSLAPEPGAERSLEEEEL
jgi:hypothetical protein